MPNDITELWELRREIARLRKGYTHVAILAKIGRPYEKCAVLVPSGQTTEFDEDGATRKWLHPYLGTEWHLVEFVEIINQGT